ncbi:MAG: peptidoglycan-associated lipoprotein Pal [Alphaproteobacteria bacterium]
MRTKLVSLFAALFLVAACETTPDESASTSGAGTTTSSSSGSSSGVTGTAVTPEATEATTDSMMSEPVPGSAEDLTINVGDRVFFSFDKSVINAAAEKTLKRQAAWMRQYATVTITVEGHADERGTREYNLALGERRSMAVKNFLVALGVSSSRIATISYGKERPDALGHSEAAWSQNRRGVSTLN